MGDYVSLGGYSTREMDIIEKNIIDMALRLYKHKLFTELQQYSEEDAYRYGKETRELMAKCDNLIKRTWEGCL